MDKNLNSQQSTFEQKNDDEIDILNIFSFFSRNKFLIGSLAFISFTAAVLYSLTLKRVWEGQFQIVLNSNQDTGLDFLNPTLRNFLGSDQNNNLKTQVGILQSPSLLMPIYDFVHAKKINEKVDQIPFILWKSKLDIELQKGTSILNIAYRDTDKEIILPALKKMSSIYQDYSGESKRREEQLANKYLIDQINLFRQKSSNSIKQAQNFAIDQNMIYLGNDPSEESDGLTSVFDPIQGSIVNIEAVRVSAANKIREINLQIKKISELDPRNYEILQYFRSSIPELSKEGLPQKLKDIENKLVALRNKYKENDISITKLLEEKKLTIDLLKSRTIKYLNIAKLEAEATMVAAMRPKDVLLRYRELTREAARDEKTLLALEDSLRKLQLQQAKVSDPWKLITKPTMLEGPVGPSRRNISILGLVFGSFLGVLLSVYKEKKSDKIYTLKQLEKTISKSFLEEISKNDDFKNSKQINFLKEFLRDQNAKKIAFISLEEINTVYLERLRDFLIKDRNISTTINLVFSQYNLGECQDSDFSILFTSLNSLSFSEIKDFYSKLNFLGIDLKGYILLS